MSSRSAACCCEFAARRVRFGFGFSGVSSSSEEVSSGDGSASESEGSGSGSSICENMIAWASLFLRCASAQPSELHCRRYGHAPLVLQHVFQELLTQRVHLVLRKELMVRSESRPLIVHARRLQRLLRPRLSRRWRGCSPTARRGEYMVQQVQHLVVLRLRVVLHLRLRVSAAIRPDAPRGRACVMMASSSMNSVSGAGPGPSTVVNEAERACCGSLGRSTTEFAACVHAISEPLPPFGGARSAGAADVSPSSWPASASAASLQRGIISACVNPLASCCAAPDGGPGALHGVALRSVRRALG
jgi:hypothetical protein